MKKTIKRMLAVGCSAVLLAGCVSFVGCKEDKEQTASIMNVSLNPEVEFVLDENNVVLSANALNEEGNLLLTAAVFTGKSAEEAVELFVQVSEETGFLFEGEISDGENEISISISGDQEKAKALYKDVEKSVKELFEEIDIEGKIQQAAAITEEQLRALVAECEPYLTEAKLKALDYMELVETIAQSRKETAEFYSQELKNAYYEAKAFVMKQAELEVLKSKMGIIEQAAVDSLFMIYTQAVKSMEETRMTYLVAEDSVYQKALADFRAKKTAYLNFRAEVAAMEQTALTEQVLAQLTTLESALDSAESALLSAGEFANKAIDAAKAQMQTTYDNVVALMSKQFEEADKYIDQISKEIKTATNEFFTAFETNYESAITAAKDNWTEMKNNLQQSVDTQE